MTADASHQAPGASRLVYSLYANPVPLSPLKILVVRSVCWGPWSVEFTILGASHAMTLSHMDGDGDEGGERCITELLSCLAPTGALQTLAERVVCPVLTNGEPEDQWPICVEASGLRIRVQTAHGPLTSETSIVRSHSETDQMAYAYPNQDCDDMSWTQLAWRLSDSTLHLETLHTYPQEGLAVFTTTDVSHLDESSREL